MGQYKYEYVDYVLQYIESQLAILLEQLEKDPDNDKIVEKISELTNYKAQIIYRD